MDLMKLARKIVYEYEYWYAVHFLDKHGIQANRLYGEMCQWLQNSLEHTDYNLQNQLLRRVRYTRRYQIDFRTEEVYSFFALCWDSRVEDYLNSYVRKGNS